MLIDSLVSHWTLDEPSGQTRSDSWGSNHLTTTTPPVAAPSVTGHLGNGVGGTVGLANYPGLANSGFSPELLDASIFTVTFWFSLVDSGAGAQMMISTNDNTSHSGWDVHQLDAGTTFTLVGTLGTVGSKGSINVNTGSSPLSYNTTYFCGFVVPGLSQVARIEVFNTLGVRVSVASSTITAAPANPIAELAIGADKTAGANHMIVGSWVDHVSYWNRALSSTELIELANGGAGSHLWQYSGYPDDGSINREGLGLGFNDN